MPPQNTIGVIGLGAMGLPLARALATAGPVVVHDASPSARRRAAEPSPLSLLSSAAEVGAGANTVVLSLPSAEAVADVVEEVCPAAPGLLILDTSTIGPDDSRQIAARALELGSTYLDTPVLGRPEAVGAWTLLMGGPASAVPAVTSLMAPVAARVVHVGEVGAAATLKVANNLMFSVINAVTAEALLLVEAAGLDPAVFVDAVVDSGAATVSGLFRSVAPKAVAGDYEPTFTLELTRKDNDLAVSLAQSLGVPLEVGQAARDLHDRAVAAGHGDLDSIAVLELLREERSR